MKRGPQVFSYRKLPGGDSFDELHPVLPVMNNTKWEELRVAMYDLASTSPKFRCMNLDGYYSQADGEWFYHFRDDGYDTIYFVDLILEAPATREIVRAALKAINMPGEETSKGFRIYGYAHEGQVLEYID